MKLCGSSGDRRFSRNSFRVILVDILLCTTIAQASGWSCLPDQCVYDPFETVQALEESESCFNSAELLRRYHIFYPVPYTRFDNAFTTSLGSSEGDSENSRRRREILKATRHAWESYVTYAWGHDELKPLSKSYSDGFGGLGVTIVDSLSTLYIMGLHSEFSKAREWIQDFLNFDQIIEANFFETTIRVLGGLLSAHDLSQDKLFLHKAEDLARRLSFAYHSPSGIPFPLCDLKARECFKRVGAIPLAEVGTVQLELRALSLLSNDSFLQGLRYSSDDFLRIAGLATEEYNGVLPSRISIDTGSFLASSKRTAGAPSDSYFEYLFKLWVQSGYQDQSVFELFRKFVKGILDEFIVNTDHGETFLWEITREHKSGKIDHFTCFLPAVLVSASHSPFAPLSNAERSLWTELAINLTETCHQFYAKSPCGLSGEHINFGNGKWRQHGGYQLRPEALEAFFFMWRYTHEQKYRNYAWEIFERIQEHCLVPDAGYAALVDSRTRKPKKEDTMHSFILSETFKYLFLIYSDDGTLSLDRYVFNTEAHPLIISPEIRRKETWSWSSSMFNQSP
uniref:alpha-1,2-Mannosidase n=1 Tax=Timspurckia oligopyrenoides TaxID=708627 RepID=A0A7S0ZJ52_9RHOD|mmetsp:Transcript_7378/g.13317  ORF Transcript_7378/g.13317 Transcript_7378/m.13317 type:complete len:566 (+) Transcript_7378:92-1789(+)